MLTFPIRIIKHDTKIAFTQRRYFAYILSIFLTIISAVSLYKPGLNFGIDFTGGAIIEVSSKHSAPPLDLIRKSMHTLGYTGITIQNDNHNNFMIRMQMQNSGTYDLEMQNIKAVLREMIPGLTFNKIDYVGPKVSEELIRDSVIAVIASLVAMMLYVTIRFSWTFGLGIVIALVHDVVATLGFYAIAGLEFDLTSIAAILTIVGYSVNDSVVIYDRIRGNIRKHSAKKLEALVNLSINETLSRTIMTVTTTLAVCLALVIFGGEALRGLSLAMFFGIGFGTYSSIYISAPILLEFSKESEE